jgi:methyl-accepting chemotaxis protein
MHRRRHFIVEGSFQTRLILRFVLVVVGATLLSTAAILGLFYFKYEFKGANFENIVIIVTDRGETDVSGLFQIVLTPLIAANLFVLCIIVPFSLFYSHKIAGPIYRLEQSLDLLINGDMDFIITLRKNDEFKYLADKMNALIDYMRRNVGEVRSSYRLIQEKIGKISASLHLEQPDLSTVKKEVMELERFFSERKKPSSY